MRRSALAGLFATVLVALPSAVAAAWVLWWEEKARFLEYRTADANVTGAKRDYTESASWNIVGSFEAAASCAQQQEGKVQEVLTQWRNEKSDSASAVKTSVTHTPGGNVVSLKQETANEDFTRLSWLTLRYLCLPDTIDPRGPKGGRP